jgi:hypothetical protein
MRKRIATARGVVAALMAVLLGLPAAVLAADGGASPDTGTGGVSYRETPPPGAGTSTGGITLSVASGAWRGRFVRIRGSAPHLAERTVAIERRRSQRAPWERIATGRVAEDGAFSVRWRFVVAGRHHLRAVAAGASASSAGSTGPQARSASAVRRVTVYRRAMATWYGPGFYGNRTACGQRLTTSTLGVAHKTLPCGTRVALRYRGRSLVVPVIDRGPYAAGIAYDLTGATARQLGVAHTVRIGAARVPR